MISEVPKDSTDRKEVSYNRAVAGQYFIRVLYVIEAIIADAIARGRRINTYEYNEILAIKNDSVLMMYKV